jgi:alpha-glucosidase
MPQSWAALTAQAQELEPTSTLNLYRTALSLRAAIHGTSLHWLPSPPDTLVFGRDVGFACAINLGQGDVDLQLNVSSILHASSPLTAGPGPTLTLPGDTAIWLKSEF